MTRTFQTSRTLALFTVLGMVALCSCATNRTGSNRVSANNSKIITMDEYNQFAQDILSILQQKLQTLRNDRGGRPVRLAIGEFKNKTSNSLGDFGTHKDILYGQIRKVLVNSGLAQVSMDVGEDTSRVVQENSSLRNSIEYDQSTVRQTGSMKNAEFIIWGDIVNISYSEGRTTNNDYALDLRLVDNESGYTVFEDQVQLQKQFTKGFFGG
jgi:PBP1b-binding outer membrane lipoprotein LpoB